MVTDPTMLRARELLAKHTLPELPELSRLSQRGANDEGFFFASLLEAAFLIAAADGELAKEEVGSLCDLISQMSSETVSPGDLADMLAEFSAHLEREGRTTRIQAIASMLTDPLQRREVLGFAALIALCDRDLAPSELFVLHSIGKAFGLETPDVNQIIRNVQAALD